MDIRKSKIYELWNIDHNKIIKYRQVIKNNTLNELFKIETDNLNELIKEVRSQINKWNDIGWWSLNEFRSIGKKRFWKNY